MARINVNIALRDTWRAHSDPPGPALLRGDRRRGGRVWASEIEPQPHGRSSARSLRLPPAGGGEDAERAHQALVDRHHRARVVKLAAVVGRAEDRDELPVGEELVAVLDDLVRADDEVVVVLREELADDVGAEGVRDAAVVLGPEMSGSGSDRAGRT